MVSSEQSRKQGWLNQIASRALSLLQSNPDPQAQITWADNQLEEANLYDPPLSRLSPQDWTEQAIAQNLDVMDQSIPWLEERDSHPEKSEDFEELILSLIPKEGGL